MEHVLLLRHYCLVSYLPVMGISQDLKHGTEVFWNFVYHFGSYLRPLQKFGRLLFLITKRMRKLDQKLEGECPNIFNNFYNLIYRVRHMSWYGVSNGCSTKMADAMSTKIFTAICYGLWQLFWNFASFTIKEISFLIWNLTKN